MQAKIAISLAFASSLLVAAAPAPTSEKELFTFDLPKQHSSSPSDPFILGYKGRDVQFKDKREAVNILHPVHPSNSWTSPYTFGFKGRDADSVSNEARGFADYGSLISAIINGFNAIRSSSKEAEDFLSSDEGKEFVSKLASIQARDLVEERGAADYGSLISAIINGFNAIRTKATRDLNENERLARDLIEERGFADYGSLISAIINGFNAIRTRAARDLGDEVEMHQRDAFDPSTLMMLLGARDEDSDLLG